MHLFAGLATRDTIDASSALTTISLEDFLANVPPRDLRIGVGVSITTDLLYATE